MANFGHTSRNVTTTFALPNSHKVYNITSPGTANTEFSQVLTGHVKKLIIRVRGLAKLQYTFTALESGTKFITVRAATVQAIDGVDIISGTIYMQVNAISQVVEIEEWT